MKKIVSLFITALLLLVPLTACNKIKNSPVGEYKVKTYADGTPVLRICNCEDYIDENVIDMFIEYMAEEKGQEIEVEYSTFGTNENLYNDLKIAKGYLYDVICPSDYMIEKMAKEGMLYKIPSEDLESYNTHVSPFIYDIFNDKITWEGNSLADYAACYMWGTIGLVYNPEIVDPEDMKSWLSLWKSEYKNLSTIKDSVRDSYFIGIAGAQKELLDSLDKDAEDYNDRLYEIFNDTTPETVAKVEQALRSLKNNIFGFEVDSGKNDMITGKIAINFAWSGDAVYILDEAEDDVTLYYEVPEEGSNIWFDGWCIPKDAKQKDLAVEFMNFINLPEIAVMNMEYIGYTSGVRGDTPEGFDVTYYEYDDQDEIIPGSEEVVHYDSVLDWLIQYRELEEEEVEGYTAVDLTYFFGEDEEDTVIVYVADEEVGRQLSAMYPDNETRKRCVVMRAYDEDENKRINKMWENVKGFSFTTLELILIGGGAVLIIGGALLIKYRDNIFRRKERKVKEGWKVVSVK